LKFRQDKSIVNKGFIILKGYVALVILDKSFFKGDFNITDDFPPVFYDRKKVGMFAGAINFLLIVNPWIAGCFFF
jgi:hypothetical protein